MSYGSNFSDMFRRAANLVSKILRGAKPADIPVEHRLASRGALRPAPQHSQAWPTTIRPRHKMKGLQREVEPRRSPAAQQSSLGGSVGQADGLFFPRKWQI